MPDPKAPFPIRLPNGDLHHGTVHLSEVLDHPNIQVGAYTYYSDFDMPKGGAAIATRIAPFLWPNQPETLRIGRFCQIAHGVRFITASANHAMDGITTFPFPVFDPETIRGYHPDRRDTVVGHDVWLAYGAMVLPGAQIGNGVIVGAGAVVRGHVPDYAVVIGNPAQVIRMRFPEAEVAALSRIAWWNWPDDVIAAHRDLIQSGDVAALERVAP